MDKRTLNNKIDSSLSYAKSTLKTYIESYNVPVESGIQQELLHVLSTIAEVVSTELKVTYIIYVYDSLNEYLEEMLINKNQMTIFDVIEDTDD